MTIEKMQKAWRLHEKIEGLKRDLDAAQSARFINGTGCSREPEDAEAKLNDDLRAYVTGRIKRHLESVERAFTKL